MKRKTPQKTVAKISVDPIGSTLPKADHSPKEMEVQIKRRAYDLYLARRRMDGDDQGDWFRAEKEIIGTQKQL
jgi:hypothetical protein